MGLRHECQSPKTLRKTRARGHRLSGRLRLCSGGDAVKKFKRAGWTVDRQVGSHVMLVKAGYPYTLSVPQHPELGLGLLRKLLKQAGLSVEAFNNL